MKSQLGSRWPWVCSRKPLRVSGEVLGPDRARQDPEDEGRQAWGKRQGRESRASWGWARLTVLTSLLAKGRRWEST